MSESSRLVLEPGYFALARSLHELLKEHFERRGRDRTVIGIAGESGSGKSVTATCLARELGAAGIATGVIHQDDYFLRPPRANHAYRCLDLRQVGPHEVDLELLQRHVEDFHAARNNVSAPLVDSSRDVFLSRRLDFAPLNTLIVEGTYVLTLERIGIRIFLDATHEQTRDRRRRRNRDVDAPVIDQILAIEHAIIAPLAQLAQIVIDSDFAIKKRS